MYVDIERMLTAIVGFGSHIGLRQLCDCVMGVLRVAPDFMIKG